MQEHDQSKNLLQVSTGMNIYTKIEIGCQSILSHLKMHDIFVHFNTLFAYVLLCSTAVYKVKQLRSFFKSLTYPQNYQAGNDPDPSYSSRTSDITVS